MGESPFEDIRSLDPDIPLLQFDLLVEEHVGDHFEVRSVIGYEELVLPQTLGGQQSVFGQEILHRKGHNPRCIEHIDLEI